MSKDDKYICIFLISSVGFGIISKVLKLIIAKLEMPTIPWLVFMVLYTIAILCGIVSILLGVVFIAKSSTESIIEIKREIKRKESLIAKLNKEEFKEIKLKKEDNEFFNAFLNITIRAKIHPDNDEIVILGFCFDDDSGLSHWKSVPVSKKYIANIIEDVIEINGK